MTTLKQPCHVRLRADGVMGNMLADTLWLAKREFEREQERRLQAQLRKARHTNGGCNHG